MSRFFAVLSVGLLCAKAAIAAPQAMLTGVKGRVQIVRGGKVLPARDGSPLQTGDIVRVTQGGATVFSLSRAPQSVKAGQQVKVGASGAASAPSLWRNVYGGLSQGLSRRYEKAPAATRRGQVRLLSPLGAILETRPVFAWTLPESEAANVVDYEISFGERGQAQNPFIAQSSAWSLPPDAALVAGRAYSWRVAPRMRNAQGVLQAGQAREGTFQIASVQAAREAQAESAQLERELAGAPISTRRLAQAAALAQRGFTLAAIRTLAPKVETQLSSNSDDATLARLLPQSDDISRLFLHALLVDLETPAAPVAPIVKSVAPVKMRDAEAELDGIIQSQSPAEAQVEPVTTISDAELMAEMQSTLPEMQRTADAQHLRIEPPSSAALANPDAWRKAEAALQAAPQNTLERVGLAKTAAEIAAHLGWTAYDAGRFDEAATFFARRAALRAEAYNSERAFYEAKLEVTAKRLAALRHVQPAADQGFGVYVLKTGLLSLQGGRVSLLQIRARDHNDAASLLRYGIYELRLHQQELEEMRTGQVTQTLDAPNVERIASAKSGLQAQSAANVQSGATVAQVQKSIGSPTHSRTGKLSKTPAIAPPVALPTPNAAALAASQTREFQIATTQVRIASTWETIGGALGDLGRFAPGEAAYHRGLALRELLPTATENRSLDAPWRGLATLFNQSGDQIRTRDALERALSALEVSRPNREASLQAQTARFTSNPQLGDILRASLVLDQAVVLNNLGSVSMSMGNYAIASGYFNRALAALEPLPQNDATLWVRQQMRSKILGNLAVLHSDSGEIDEGLKVNAEVIALRREIHADDDAALALLNQSGMLREKGDNQGARNALMQARQIFVASQDLTGVLASGAFLSRIARESKQLDESDKWARETLLLARKTGAREWVAAGARSLANNALLRAKPQDALPYINEAESLSSLLASPSDSAMTLDVKGRALEATGDFSGALKQFEAAVTLLESVRATVASAGAFSDQSDILKVYEHTVRVLLKLGRGADALDYLNRARSKKLQDSLRFSNLQTPDRALQVLLDLAGSLEGRLGVTRLALQSERAKPAPDPARVKNLQLIAASTQQEFFQVTARLRAQHPGYEKVLGVRPLELKQAQKSIPADTVLVQYAPIDDQLYIFVVTRDTLKILTPPVQPDELFKRIREFRKLMDDAEARQARGESVSIPNWNASDLSTSTLRDNLSGLYEMLLSPIEAEVKDKTTVAFVPSGPLFYLPIHALAKRTPTGLRFFIEDKRVTYLTGADVLAVAQGGEKASHRGLLALGNPSGAQLPNALTEVQSIARVYPDARVLSGAAATKSALLTPANLERGILHLATHSVLNAVAPDQSYIQLAPGASPTDARLSIGEIYGLNLQGVDLVTLSACQTALGEREPDGGEITSMAEAFAGAGAPSVIASLWSVSDDSTAGTMSAFYASLASGKSKAESLQSAQIATLRDPRWNHPFHWAPFVLMGDWR